MWPLWASIIYQNVSLALYKTLIIPYIIPLTCANGVTIMSSPCLQRPKTNTNRHPVKRPCDKETMHFPKYQNASKEIKKAKKTVISYLNACICSSWLQPMIAPNITLDLSTVERVVLVKQVFVRGKDEGYK